MLVAQKLKRFGKVELDVMEKDGATLLHDRLIFLIKSYEWVSPIVVILKKETNGYFVLNNAYFLWHIILQRLNFVVLWWQHFVVPSLSQACHLKACLPTVVLKLVSKMIHLLEFI